MQMLAYGTSLPFNETILPLKTSKIHFYPTKYWIMLLILINNLIYSSYKDNFALHLVLTFLQIINICSLTIIIPTKSGFMLLARV